MAYITYLAANEVGIIFSLQDGRKRKERKYNVKDIWERVARHIRVNNIFYSKIQ